MSCANLIKKQIGEDSGGKRQKIYLKVPRKQIAFVNMTKDKKCKLTRQKLNNDTAAKRQTACVITAKILYRFPYIIFLNAVKKQMASSILEEESTDNSLPVSLLLKNMKLSSLCNTHERP